MKKLELNPEEIKELIFLLNNQLDVISEYSKFYKDEIKVIKKLLKDLDN
jgi:hypothetical protein